MKKLRGWRESDQVGKHTTVIHTLRWFAHIWWWWCYALVAESPWKYSSKRFSALREIGWFVLILNVHISVIFVWDFVKNPVSDFLEEKNLNFLLALMLSDFLQVTRVWKFGTVDFARFVRICRYVARGFFGPLNYIDHFQSPFSHWP